MPVLKKNIELVVFDLDGTLIDAYAAVEWSINHTLKAVGCPPVDAETIRRTVGWGDRHLVHAFVGPKKIARAIRIYRAHHTDSLKRGTKLLPGAKKTLQYLKKHRYKIAVASNRPTKYTKIILSHLNIGRFFDYVLCGDKVARPKPYPDLLLKILKRMAVPPHQALYVGDMTIDIQAGKRARVRTVALTTGSCPRAQLKRLRPEKMFSRVDSILTLLNHR